MGNYRFKISDMMPNAWFYKLRDMGKARTHSSKKKQPCTSAATAQQSKPKQPHLPQPRKSYYFTRDRIPSDRFYNSPTNPKTTDTHFPDPPRKSSRRKSNRKSKRHSPRLVGSSVSAGCSCRATLDSVWTQPESTPEYSTSPLDSSPDSELGEPFLPELRSDGVLPTESFDGMVSWPSSCGCRVNSTANDIVLDVNTESFDNKCEELGGFDVISGVELPPIVTKPTKFDDGIRDVKNRDAPQPIKFRRSSAKYEERNRHGSVSVKVVKEERIASPKEQRTSPIRRISANSPGVRLRINSPRIASRRIQAHGRKSVSSTSSSSSRRSISDSFAVVKSSFNPQRDFRDSMMEMIVQNNISASKDLEELLACYLSLNSDEYHDLIINVFKQIWFDLTDDRTK